MTNGQADAVCPQCGSAAAVHSIEELAALAKSRLGQQGQGSPVPPWQADATSGPGATPGPGAAPGQEPVPGYAAEPRPIGQGPVPGYAAEPRPISQPSGWQGGRPRSPNISSRPDDFMEDLTGVAVSAAARFIGRAISRRVQRTVEQQVMPAMAAKQGDMLRQQVAIAERHPDLRACLTDQVIFLAGGSRVVPLSSVNGMLTVEQSDELVATLRNG